MPVSISGGGGGGGGSVSFPLDATAGTVSAPSLYFGDSTTGLFKNGSNVLGFTGNGVNVANFSSSGSADPIAFKNGLIRVGSASDGAGHTLEINATKLAIGELNADSQDASNPALVNIRSFNDGTALLKAAGHAGDSNDYYRLTQTSSVITGDWKQGGSTVWSMGATGVTTMLNVNISGLTASRALALDGSKNVVVSATTATELGYLNGVTGAIQTQLNLLAPKASPTFSGTITQALTNGMIFANGSGVLSKQSTGTNANYLLMSDGAHGLSAASGQIYIGHASQWSYAGSASGVLSIRSDGAFNNAWYMSSYNNAFSIGTYYGGGTPTRIRMLLDDEANLSLSGQSTNTGKTAGSITQGYHIHCYSVVTDLASSATATACFKWFNDTWDFIVTIEGHITLFSTDKADFFEGKRRWVFYGDSTVNGIQKMTADAGQVVGTDIGTAGMTGANIPVFTMAYTAGGGGELWDLNIKTTNPVAKAARMTFDAVVHTAHHA